MCAHTHVQSLLFYILLNLGILYIFDEKKQGKIKNIRKRCGKWSKNTTYRTIINMLFC